MEKRGMLTIVCLVFVSMLGASLGCKRIRDASSLILTCIAYKNTYFKLFSSF